jgi:5-methyltetrahydropteroyltriglutamate--homocysteine methyltransferase
MKTPPLPTSLVGSYPQPGWLIDRDRLSKLLPVRVRGDELWRVPRETLGEAQDDATVLALHDQHRAGLDVVTDGEARRVSYSNRFATALDGIDVERPGRAVDRTGADVAVPRVVGRIRRTRPVEVDTVRYLRAHTDRAVKVTLPGPFTMAQQAQDDYYGDEAELAMAYAVAVNDELHDLFAVGADVVQLDEPYLEARPDRARDYAMAAIDRALAGANGTTVLHVCFGYGHHIADKTSGYRTLDLLDRCAVDEISLEAAQPRLDLSHLAMLRTKRVHLGVLDLRDQRIESADEIASRVRAALGHVGPDRLGLAPDCGMKYLRRDVAYAKLTAMVDAARTIRAEL